MSKPNKKESSQIFTIQFDQVNDSSEIPGIAQLLDSKISAKQTAQEGAMRSGIKFKSLQEFGTKLEIHFLLDQGSYHYLQHDDLSVTKFLGTNELFNKMKIPTKFVNEFGTFGEFKQIDKTFLFDAFGITEQRYMQFVLNQANKILTVYVSEKSMLSKKDAVIEYAETKNAALGASGIELDLVA